MNSLLNIAFICIFLLFWRIVSKFLRIYPPKTARFLFALISVFHFPRMQRTFFSFLLPPLRYQIQNHTNHFQMKHRLHLICRQMNLGYFRFFPIAWYSEQHFFIITKLIRKIFRCNSSATNLPLFIIITLSQTALIRLIYANLKLTSLFFSVSSLITFLISNNSA